MHLVLAGLLLSCTDKDPAGDSGGWTAGDPVLDVEHMDLSVELATRTGRAEIRVRPTDPGPLRFAAGDLDITAVQASGALTDWERDGTDVIVQLPPDATVLTFDYTFSDHDFAGYAVQEDGVEEGEEAGGYTVTWPIHCQNLFPCSPHPSDGLTWTLAVTVAPDDHVVVAPDVQHPSPAYMVAWAHGPFEETVVGTTPAGTTLRAWAPADKLEAQAEGNAGLVDGFAFLESTYGAYPYGDEAGTVAVPWGATVAGAIEHHPYWHTGEAIVDREQIQLHEAAHGWFGNGVRLTCWEDLMLSEGVAEYLGNRAVEAALGAKAAEEAWASTRSRLDGQLGPLGEDHVARPEGCAMEDPTELMDFVVYGKGAFFLAAVEAEVGREAMDGVLAGLFAAHVGETAGVADLLAAIRADTGFDPTELADAWLYGLGIPGPELGGWETD